MTTDTTTSTAPWTEEQAEALNRWQSSPTTPSFTCERCRDNDTRALIARFHAEGEPADFKWTPGPEHALVATTDGWKCETCDYTQDWAHPFMMQEPPPDPLGRVAVLAPTGHHARAALAKLAADDPDPWMLPVDAVEHLDHAADVLADLEELFGQDGQD